MKITTGQILEFARKGALLCAVVLAGLTFAPPTPAQAASVEAKIDSPKGIVGASITLTITVTGARSIGKVSMPSLPAFDVVSAGGLQMRSGYVAGRPVQQALITYYLYPKEEGSFTIDAIGVYADNQTLWTRPLKITVGATRAPSAGPEEDQFLRAWVEPESIYSGQPILFHVELGIASSIKNFERDDPDWGGLVKEADLEPDVNERFQIIEGRTFRIIQWRIPLFSMRPGKYEIGEMTARFDQVVGYSRRTHPLFNDPIFEQLFATAQLKPVALVTEPIEVEVLALPDAGKPESFSGLVGTARLMGELSRNQCQVGESVTLSLAIQGSGNLQDVDLDIVDPEGLKVYAEDKLVNLDWGPDGPYGTVARRFDLVPLVPGEAVLPTIEIGTYDPVARRYKTTSAGPFRISIGGEGEGDSHGAHSADLLVDDAAIEMLNREPFPVMRGAGWRRMATPARFVWLALVFVLPVGGFGSAVYVRRRQRRRADPELHRRKQAHRRATEALDRAGNMDDDPVAAAASAEEAVREFLSVLGGVTTGALSPEELTVAVREAGAPQAAESVGTWLADLGAVRYAGRREPSVAELVRRARALLDELAGELS